MGAIMRPVLARRLGLMLSGVAVALGAGVTTAQAASPVQLNQTLPVQTVLGDAVPDACTGQLVTLTGNAHAMAAITTDAAGGFEIHTSLTFEGVKGIDPTGTQYTVQLSSTQSEVWAPSSPTLGDIANVYTKTVRLDIISQNQTGNFYIDGVEHFTITPDGQITVAFLKEDTGCSA